MKSIYYIDKVTGTQSIAPITALLWCPDVRKLDDEKKVEILLAPSRLGIAKVSDIKAALFDNSIKVISAPLGYTLIALSKEGEIYERPVVAWNIYQSIEGKGIWSEPVPNKTLPLDVIGNFGGEFVAVEQPNGSVFSPYADWESREKWLRTAKAKLKKRSA